MLDFGADGIFVFLKPSLAFALYFQGVEEHVFHALEGAAMQPLPKSASILGRFISMVMDWPCKCCSLSPLPPGLGFGQLE